VRTGDETAPAFLIMAAAVSFLSVLQFRETYRAPSPARAPWQPRRRRDGALLQSISAAVLGCGHA
jgi:hypothetical protein